MKCLLPAIALVSFMSLAGPAFAVDFRQSTLDQRQVRGCMSKLMASDRTLSYYGAKKACAERLKAQNPAAASIPLLSSGSLGK